MSCPICEKTVDPKYKPFCSKRCADIDLGKWLRGDYAVPSQDPDDIEEALNQSAQPSLQRSEKPH